MLLSKCCLDLGNYLPAVRAPIITAVYIAEMERRKPQRSTTKFTKNTCTSPMLASSSFASRLFYHQQENRKKIIRLQIEIIAISDIYSPCFFDVL